MEAWPDGPRAQVTSANARPEGAQGLAVDQVTEAVAALDTDENTASNQHVSGVWRFHGQGRSPPAPLQRHAPRLDVIDYRGVPRLPRGHENPRRSRLAVCSLSLHRIRCGSSCLRRGVCPQDIAATAIRHWIAPFGAHVGFSRPRCQWQPCGWRHPTTPSRKPHEQADGSLRILMIHRGLLTLPPWPIPHPATFESRDVLSRSLRKSRRTGRAGLRLPGPADSRYATAPRPFFATSVRSFNDAPRGRFSPRSHWLTSPVVTLR